jgi:hypothetical protein
LFLRSFASPAKLEHRRIKERTTRVAQTPRPTASNSGRKPGLTPHQRREAIKRRDVDGETLHSVARTYNVSPQTISRLDDAHEQRHAPARTLISVTCFIVR